MAPSKKSRSASKRFSQVNEVSPNKHGENATRSRGSRKRKLSDMIGPQWGKDELERFYKGYRKHGKDWEKVAAAVRNRSEEMVEALYSMNKAYLSLPKGYASAAGLIAMMTDHYSNMGDTDSDQEINEGSGASRKPQKRARATKGSDVMQVPDLLQPQSATSDYGCLSLLKKRRPGSRPWAVGKRTPRVPVTYTYDKDNEKYISPLRHGLKVKVDALDDDVAHEIALALAEASQRGGSPQVSLTPNRKTEVSSPVQKGARMMETEMSRSKLRASDLDEGSCELSLGSTEADVGDYGREKRFLKGKSWRGRKLNVQEDVENDLDDVKEACSGTEEGQKLVGSKGKFGMESADTKLARFSSKASKKRSKKVLFGEGLDADFDALEALADLSLRLPETPVDTGSSVNFEEERTNIAAKSKLNGNDSSPVVKISTFKTTKQGKGSHVPEADEEGLQINAGIRKRRQKVLPSKISESEEHIDSHLSESQRAEARDEANNLVSKGKRFHDAPFQKQGKLIKPAEHTSSSNDHGMELNGSAPATLQALSVNKMSMPTKVRSRRKISTSRLLLGKDKMSSEYIVNRQSKLTASSSPDKESNIKEKLSNCLSWYQVRRWCSFEWFYSAIDYPWFAKREFVEYLEHVGLGHIPRLTRVEWGVIRSSLGKPRRFSEQFLKEEKEKLNQYRESVRKHYTELRAGTRDGLPTDLARPLAVGQRIIALHPRTREIHDGNVLTVDHNRCRVQFDQPELGVEFVLDVDCMPMNPLENMPASLSRQNLTLNRYIESLNELKLNGQPVERKMEGATEATHHENLDNPCGFPQTSPSTCHVSNLSQQPKPYDFTDVVKLFDRGGLASSNAQVNVGLGETVQTQQAANAQPIVTQIQAKEADIQALCELTRALDKKEAVMSELKRMNDEALESQNGKNSLKDSELFKKHYAAVLLQLHEVNEQVSTALFSLRQRNTYQGNAPVMWSKPITYTGESVAHSSTFDFSADDDTQESGSHVTEIVESSRIKAQTMVDAAMQAMATLKKNGNTVDNIEEAIDFVNTQLSADDLSIPAMKSLATHTCQDQLSSCAENPGTIIIDAPNNTENNSLSSENGAQIPSELISQCVATLLMIQKCTERQFPPSDVAQVLDFAVTGLKPCSPQNLPLYAEIQKCMGIIRNQILALIPT